MRGSKRKLRRKPGWYLIVLVVAAFSLYGVVKSGQSLYKLLRLSRMKNTEESALNEALKRIEYLELEVERLTNDLSYIEKIAREEHGMKKKGEEVFKISNPETKSKAQ